MSMEEEMDEFLDLVAEYVEKITYSPDPGRELIHFINDFSKLRGGGKILNYDYAGVDEYGEYHPISEDEYLELLAQEREGLMLPEYSDEQLSELYDEIYNLERKNELLFELLEEKVKQVRVLENKLDPMGGAF